MQPRIQVCYPGGGTTEEAAAEMPHSSGEYFEIGTPHAYGLFARNIKNLSLYNIRLKTIAVDRRPAVLMDNTEDVQVLGLNVQGDRESRSVVRVRNCRDVFISAARVLKEGAVFMEVEGKKQPISGSIAAIFPKQPKTPCCIAKYRSTL
ncbi:hypothetical protein [Niabella beijingensis]|uniref:hypothetical protein n=1 Tax=Niabella beijingensis TaxID=2872700 RepID=UPI001CBDB101|nr:hypothetical protein [Niabella beijingensis]MBZ4189116.1 hypothetical protein [Niabella beijingensis]